MPTKKGATKKGGAKKGGAKKAGAKLISSKNPKSPAFPLYGRPILDAVRRGDLVEMKQIRAVAVKQVADIQGALKKLDAKVKRG
jgi:hypothetical protein